MMNVGRLHETIAAVCPILGISDYDPVAHTAVIRFDPSASGAQQTAANSALASYNWSQAAEDAWSDNQKPDRKALRDAATAAVADLDTYLVIASPSNAQVTAVVRKLCQQNKQIIKRLIQLD